MQVPLAQLMQAVGPWTDVSPDLISDSTKLLPTHEPHSSILDFHMPGDAQPGSDHTQVLDCCATIVLGYESYRAGYGASRPSCGAQGKWETWRLLALSRRAVSGNRRVAD